MHINFTPVSVLIAFFFLLFFAEEQTFKETAFAKKQKKNKV